MVLGCGLEFAATEAKGTVLLHTADELKNFTKGEEAQMEETIRKIKDAGEQEEGAGVAGRGRKATPLSASRFEFGSCRQTQTLA